MPQLGKDWIGSSISHGTLRYEELIPAFEAVLGTAGVEYDHPPSVDKLLLGQALTHDEQDEIEFYLNETLFDLIDGIAPEGTFFGSHPGDGADFGFWESEEAE